MSLSFFDKGHGVVQAEGERGDKVAILLCSFQGEQYLAEQLDSIVKQTHQNWIIYVSDDGSTDGTLDILRDYQAQLGMGRLFIFSGPGKGYVKNFFSLAKNDDVDADYFAFCDQDDVWSVDKLGVAVDWLKRQPVKTPCLYGGRTSLIDESGQKIGLSPLFKFPPSFKNALVQSIAGGNTMVFNRSVKKILGETLIDSTVISHDWWLYILVTACGGVVKYDPTPYISYRQHGNNLIGANTGLHSSLLRFKRMLEGRLTTWNESNLSAIQTVKPFMPRNNLQTLTQFELGRCSSLVKRCFLFKRSGVYRQTFQGNIALLVAVVLGKV